MAATKVMWLAYAQYRRVKGSIFRFEFPLLSYLKVLAGKFWRGKVILNQHNEGVFQLDVYYTRGGDRIKMKNKQYRSKNHS